MKKGEAVFLQVPESAKLLLIALNRAVLRAGAHPIIQYLPDEMVKEFVGLNFEIARKREVKDGNSGLPKGAVKFPDKEVDRLLQEMRIEEIRFYKDTHHCINGGLFALVGYEVEESDFHSPTFNDQLHPTIEGYDWYRGFAVKVNGGKVLILSGWMHPWCEGGAPDTIVYLLGEPPRETVLGVIQTYCSGILNHILKARIALRVAQEAYEVAIKRGCSVDEAEKERGIVYRDAMK